MRPVTSSDANRLLLEGSLALAECEHRGIRIDTEYIEKTRPAIQNRCKDLEQQMKQHDHWKIWRKRYGTNALLSSADQLASLLYNDLRYPITSVTKKGKPSTDISALEKIKDPFVKLYSEWAKLMKADGTFLAGIQRETVNGYLHPIFNLHLVKTFRSSSEAPNFQNFPTRSEMIARIVRSAFIPRKGRRLVEIDYSGIEVRIAACYHKDPTMLEYIHDETRDMHRDMAAEIYCCDPSDVTKMMRYVAKNKYVFPEFYGSYWKKVAPDLWESINLYDLPVLDFLASEGIGDFLSFQEHVQRVEERFWGERFPVYASWKERWYKSYLNNGGFRTLTGFYIYGPYSRNDVINYPVQGSAFHCLLWSLVEISKELKRRKMKSFIVGQIHDSIVSDVVDSEFEDFLRIAKNIMTKRLRKHWDWINVPIDIEAEACGLGESWFDKKKVELN